MPIADTRFEHEYGVAQHVTHDVAKLQLFSS